MSKTRISKVGARWLKRTVRFNLFLIAAVVLGAVLFFFVPQVSHIWKSQIPPPNVDSVWIAAWTAYAFFAVADIIFVGLSVWVVPSQPAHGWTARQRRVLPAWLRRIVDRATGIMNPLVSWLTRLGDGLGSGARFGVAIVLIAMGAASLTWGAKSESSELFLLAGAICQNFGIWSVLTSVWFFIRGRSTVTPNSDRGWSAFVSSAGRLLAWLFVANVLGEIVWLLSCYDLVSFRAYALGAILHLIALILVFARTLDHLDRRTWFPVRLVAAVVILIVVNRYLRRGPNSDLELASVAPAKVVIRDSVTGTTPRPDKPAVVDPAEVDWYDFMEDRLFSVPEEEPVMIVAASGGGSRAAIFTALVLEFLARTPVNGPPRPSLHDNDPARTWAQNIVLVSSVSGGSLAVAHFVARGGARSHDVSALRYTIRDELLADIIEEVKRLGEASGPGRSGPEWQELRAAVQTMAEDFRSIREGKKTPPQTVSGWMVGNRFVDDMCANFMAAILRGCVSFNLYRGDALARFWGELFSWEHCDNLTGYGPDRTWQAAKTSCPAVLYDACNGEEGSRLVVGFPPLPGDVFPVPSALAADNHGPPAPVDKLTRSPPAELVHLYAHVAGSNFHPRISLAKAVRLSSNFPWGFFPSLIVDTTVKLGAEDKRPETYVLDGGVVDNTGIDAIYDLFDGLRKTQRGQEILRLLARRQIVILEIDSGAKPTLRNLLQKMLPSLLEPVQALNNSSYSNADRTKRFYLQRLTELPRGIPCCPPDSAQPERPGTPDLSEADRNRSPGHVYTLSIECNHFSPGSPDKSEVMTAWALSPDEKANVVARFCYELPKLEADLEDVQKERSGIRDRQKMADRLCPNEAARRQVEATRVEKERSLHVAGVTASGEATAQQLQIASDSVQKAKQRVERVEEMVVTEPNALVVARPEAASDLDMEVDGDLDVDARGGNSMARPGRTRRAQRSQVRDELRAWRSELETGQRQLQTKAKSLNIRLRNQPPTSSEPETFTEVFQPSPSSREQAQLREALRESEKGIGDAQLSIDRRSRLSREWFDADRWANAK